MSCRVNGSFDKEETRELINKKRSLKDDLKGEMIVEIYFEYHRSVLTIVFFEDSVFFSIRREKAVSTAR